MSKGNSRIIKRKGVSVKGKVIKLLAVLIAGFSYLTAYPLPLTPVYAQQSMDFAVSYDVSDSEAISGDILISTDKGLVRATTPYANKLFGVLQDKPLISIQVSGETNQKPIARSGAVNVNVTTEGGEIKQGDYITSSAKPGKGQKAQTSGYVIGTALASLEPGQIEGQIPVAIKVEFAELDKAQSTSRIANYFGSSLLQNVKDPEKFASLVRFIVAGSIALLGFLIGFLAFSRSIPTSIEAIGRNPLAQKSILAAVVLNITLTIITTIVGIVAAFFILKM